jgi:hypothetical protein
MPSSPPSPLVLALPSLAGEEIARRSREAVSIRDYI